MQEDAKTQTMTTSPLSMFRRIFANETSLPGAASRMGRRLGSLAATALLCLTLAGCFSEQFQKGYILPENALSQIPIGASQDQVLLVLDATTGQNALNQVEVFKDKAGVTGLVMTKLDGTARGGILVAISAKFALPVHAIGVGEAVDDLAPFDAAEFARAIALS